MFCGAAENLLSFSTERNNLAIQQGKVTRAERWLTGWPRICLPEASWRAATLCCFFRLHHVRSGVLANRFSCAAEVGEPHLGILSR